MNEDKRYNGWTNYETWAVALWLDNDQGTYYYWREQAQNIQKTTPTCKNVLQGYWNEQQAAKYILADQLKEEIRENAPDNEASMYSDLLRAALDEVNWHEIAENWFSDLENIKDDKEPETKEADKQPANSDD